MPHSKRRDVAKNFCRGNTQPLFLELEKQIQNFVLIPVQVRPQKPFELLSCIYIYIYIYIYITE